MSLRIPREEKTILPRAAALKHTDLTDFVRQQSLKAAEKVIQEAERMELSKRDSLVLAVNDIDKKTIRGYYSKVISFREQRLQRMAPFDRSCTASQILCGATRSSPGLVPQYRRMRAKAKLAARLAGLGVLTFAESGCIVVGGGYGSRGGWFIWPGGLGFVLILLLLFLLFRRGR